MAITDTIRRGDVLSITGKMEKKRGIKEDKHDWRSFVALVNKTNNRVAVDEYEQSKDIIEKEFLHQLQESGVHTFQIFVFNGRG